MLRVLQKGVAARWGNLFNKAGEGGLLAESRSMPCVNAKMGSLCWCAVGACGVSRPPGALKFVAFLWPRLCGGAPSLVLLLRLLRLMFRVASLVFLGLRPRAQGEVESASFAVRVCWPLSGCCGRWVAGACWPRDFSVVGFCGPGLWAGQVGLRLAGPRMVPLAVRRLAFSSDGEWVAFGLSGGLALVEPIAVFVVRVVWDVFGSLAACARLSFCVLGNPVSWWAVGGARWRLGGIAGEGSGAVAGDSAIVGGPRRLALGPNLPTLASYLLVGRLYKITCNSMK